MFAPPTRAVAAALYRKVEEESEEFSSRLTTHAANNNMSLNRWHNILPYDSTRVVIHASNNTNNKTNNIGSSEITNSGIRTDYINANHVRIPESGKHYILTQGPIDKDDQRHRTLSNSMMLMLGNTVGGSVRAETVPHFWTMVWQQNSPAIVMLCRTHERDAYGCLQCKCARYWPKSTSEVDTMRLRDLEIRLLGEHPLKSLSLGNSSKEISTPPTGINNESSQIDNAHDTIIRKIEIHQVSTSEKRVITQYHYRKWPDFGVPEGREVNSFLKLVKLVSQENPSTEEKPNIIHCSAGVGRSGTFCLVESCLERMAKNNVPITQEQVIDTLLHMRRQRMGLIQTDDQLRFALLAISVGADEALERARNTETTNDLKTSSKKGNEVPSCNHIYHENNSSYSESITGVENPNKINGVIVNSGGSKGHSVHYVENVRSNGKARNSEGNSVANLTRKRSTDLAHDDDEHDHSSESKTGDVDGTEIREGSVEKARNSSGSTAKRKKSEKDC